MPCLPATHAEQLSTHVTSLLGHSPFPIPLHKNGTTWHTVAARVLFRRLPPVVWSVRALRTWNYSVSLYPSVSPRYEHRASTKVQQFPSSPAVRGRSGHKNPSPNPSSPHTRSLFPPKNVITERKPQHGQRGSGTLDSARGVMTKVFRGSLLHLGSLGARTLGFGIGGSISFGP